MARKILKILSNNVGYKILAVVLAFIMWLVVYNLDDPVKTKTFTVTVNVTGASAVEDIGKWPTIVEETRSVSFTVSAKRSIISELDDSDFTASADLSNLIIDDQDSSVGTARIDVTANKYRNSITVNAQDKYVKVQLEDFVSKQFVVSPTVTGSKDGYVIGDEIKAEPEVIRIDGAASSVDAIDKVSAKMEITDNSYVNENNICQDNAAISLLDAEGNEVPRNKLRIESSDEIITVSVQMYNTKEVPLECTYTGTPAGGSSVLGMTISQQTVMVKGTADALANLTRIDLGTIDVSRATSDVITTLDITSYLPSGVTLVSSADSSVTITVRIQTNNSETISLSTDNITIGGLENGMKATFQGSAVNLVVSGTSEAMQKLDSTKIKGSVDLSGLGVGTHTVTVTINLDSQEYTWTETKIEVTIEAENSGDSGNDSGNDSSEN